MKKILFVVAVCLVGLSSNGQSIDGLLDNVMSLQKKGDNKGLTTALGSLTAGLEKEVGETGGDFKAGLLSQVGSLKKLIPFASKGLLKAGSLKKIINTIKVMLGANRLGNMLGVGSLLGKAAAVKSGLGLMKAGSSIMGSKSGELNDLIGSAMGNSDKLDGGGLAAKGAEKVLSGQLGGILTMVKGVL
ncbi:MAG: hypothetical protein ACI9IP_000441 [Arcticibacterium sp.]|jgi:hypothetical protein